MIEYTVCTHTFFACRRRVANILDGQDIVSKNRLNKGARRHERRGSFWTSLDFCGITGKDMLRYI